MCAVVISCCYAPPVFQSSKHVFDFMPLFIRGFAVSGWEILTFSRRNAGRYSFGFERGAEFVAVLSFITKQMGSAFRQSRIDQFCSNMIAHIPLAQAHDYRSTFSITNRMLFGVQTAFCTPNTAGNIPFFSRLQAVR